MIMLISWDVEKYLYCNCSPICEAINFEINPRFLIKLFSHMTKKIQDKNLNILTTKRALEISSI